MNNYVIMAILYLLAEVFVIIKLLQIIATPSSGIQSVSSLLFEICCYLSIMFMLYKIGVNVLRVDELYNTLQENGITFEQLVEEINNK